MKRSVVLLFIAFAFVANMANGQSIPGFKDGPRSILNDLPSTIVGAYPQQVDWFNWVSSAWAPDRIQKLSYTPSGDPLTIEWDLATGTDQKFTYAYNNLRMPTMMLYQEFTGGAWVNKERSRIEYDAHNNPTLEVSEVYSGGTWVMEGGMQFTNTVVNGRLMQMAVANYDKATSQYVTVSRTTYTYTAGGQMSSYINEVILEGVWMNSAKVTITYKTSDFIDVMIMEEWKEGAWAPMMKYMYEWNENESFTINIFMWDEDSSAYVLSMREVTQYDSHSNLILQTTEMSMVGTWFTLSGSKFDITYQGNNPTQQITQTWDGTQFVNSTKEVFTNYLNLGVGDIIADILSFDVYPNPATESLTIKVTGENPSGARIEVISITGKVVRSAGLLHSDNQLNLDIASLQAGVYAVRLVSSNGSVISKKILKQ